MNSNLFKSGIVSISGNPNVGKSTLLNFILGQKLAIVTPKPQTTRGAIRGIYNRENMQILFVDNPGFLKPKSLLDDFMIRQARKNVKNADLVYYVVEPRIPDELDVKNQVSLFKREKKPVFLLINKVDSIIKCDILPIIDKYKLLYEFDGIFPVSALKGDNIDVLLKKTEDILPQGEPIFPPDMISDQYERYFVEELIREKIFFLTQQEVPYSTTVKVNEFKQQNQDKTYIRADIIVEREAHKPIIIGKGGVMIKKIGQKSRLEIEKFLGEPCYLELFVKVVKDWKNTDSKLRSFGYER